MLGATGCLLEGVRVLDLSRVLAGPLATQILGDLGADVLKIEAPWGDDTRRWGPPFHDEVSTYYLSCNRNRSSLVLDLRSAAGRERVGDLAAAADVVVDNFTPARRRRLGLDAPKLALRNPAVVAVSITGYPGIRADEPGYDLVMQAESGLMGITGPADGEPHKVGVAVVDVMTGMMAANAMLAGLVRQGRNGQGVALSVSLFHTAVFSLVNVASASLASGEPSRRWGNAHPSLVPYESFAAADRSIVIAVGSDQQWRLLCSELGIDDPELRKLGNAERVARRGAIATLIGDAVAPRPAADVVGQLRRAGIPSAPILTPEEALLSLARTDPQAIIAVEHPRHLQPVAAVPSPIRGDGVRVQHQAAPDLGEGGELMAAEWLAKPRGVRG